MTTFFKMYIQIENDLGKWAKLSSNALDQFNCTKREGYALAFSKAKNDILLDEIEPEEIKHVVKKPQYYGQRKGTCISTHSKYYLMNV